MVLRFAYVAPLGGLGLGDLLYENRLLEGHGRAVENRLRHEAATAALAVRAALGGPSAILLHYQ